MSVLSDSTVSGYVLAKPQEKNNINTVYLNIILCRGDMTL